MLWTKTAWLQPGEAFSPLAKASKHIPDDTSYTSCAHSVPCATDHDGPTTKHHNPAIGYKGPGPALECAIDWIGPQPYSNTWASFRDTLMQPGGAFSPLAKASKYVPDDTSHTPCAHLVPNATYHGGPTALLNTIQGQASETP